MTTQTRGPAACQGKDTAGPRHHRCEECGAWQPAYPVCACGHLDLVHDLRGEKRTACSVATGPKATPCGCRVFEEATP